MNSPYLSGFQWGLKPDTCMTVSEWADEHRILPMKSAKEAGRWRTARTPYLKEIMDCLSPSSPVERVVFMKGAQVGGTECGNNWQGYVIHHTPEPTQRQVCAPCLPGFCFSMKWMPTMMM